MLCRACGKENVAGAKFCAFCGARLTSPKVKPPAEEALDVPTQRSGDLRPIKDNPVRPPRAPSDAALPKPRQMPVQKAAHAARQDGDAIYRRPAAPGESPDGSNRTIRPAGPYTRSAPKRAPTDDTLAVRPRPTRSAAAPPKKPFLFDDEDDEDDEDYEYGTSVRAKVIGIGAVVLALIVAFIFIMYSPTGRRLRASMGISSSAEDFMVLADWQKGQGNHAAAEDSYYNAFKLNQGDFNFALRVGAGFESVNALKRAEQLYMYLTDLDSERDEPFDRLAALFKRQEKTEEYDRLLIYRAEKQGTPLPDESPIVTIPIGGPPAMPQPSLPAGEYDAPIQLQLTAEAGATIYYTRDGTAPNLNSHRYIGPILIEGGTFEIHAIAERGGQTSPVFDGIYVVAGTSAG